MPARFPLMVNDLVHLDVDRASLGYRRLLADIVSGAWTPSARAGARP